MRELKPAGIGAAILAAAATAAWGQTWTGKERPERVGTMDVWKWRQNNRTDNWSAAPVSNVGTALRFTGNQGLVSFQNIANPFRLNKLTFDDKAGPFTLENDPLQFNRNGNNGPWPVFRSDSGQTQVIRTPIELAAETTFEGTGKGNVRIDSVISGAGGLTLNASYRITMLGSGDNTYRGSTFVEKGTLHLKKPAGKNAIPGELDIGDNGFVQLLASDQIADSARVSVNGDLYLNGFNETIGGLSGSGIITLDGNSNLTINNAANSRYAGAREWQPHQER